MFNGKSILISGGTGCHGRNFIRSLLEQYQPKRVMSVRDPHFLSVGRIAGLRVGLSV